MNKFILYGLGLMLCLINTTYAQQVSEEWARHYDSKGPTSEEQLAYTVDEAGNSYLAGSSGDSLVIIKYSPEGEVIWIEKENLSFAKVITADKNGSLYVATNAGYLSSQVSRYDAADGSLAWAIPLNLTIAAIAVDNLGGLYVTSTDAVTSRYDAVTGSQSWSEQYSGEENSILEITEMTVDDQGGIFITGYSDRFADSGYTLNFITVAYDAINGSQRWAKQLPSRVTVNGSKSAVIATDNQGGVHVTGSSYTDYNRVSDLVSVRYDALTGERSWFIHDDGGGEMLDVSDIAVDNQGGVYITGTIYSSISDSGIVSDYFTLRLEATTGNQTWFDRYTGQGNQQDKYTLQDEATAIAIDNNGGVYVTGFSYFNNANSWDYVTIRYLAETGERDWISNYDGQRDFDRATSIAFSNNSIYVSGISFGSTTGRDFATVRYEASTGRQVWATRYNGTGSQNDIAIAVVTDGEGNSYVTGTSFNFASNSTKITTIKYSPSGELLWEKVYKENGPGNSGSSGIALDNTGGVYVTGIIDDRVVTIRYEASSGEETWDTQYSKGTNTPSRPAGIAVDNAGSVYITGYIYYWATEKMEYLTIRYDAGTGKIIWDKKYSPDNRNFRNEATAIAVDHLGSVFVTGTSYGDSWEDNSKYITIRYDAASGKRLWARKISSLGLSSAAIAVDAVGGVYFAAGIANYDAVNVAAIHYGSDGSQLWSTSYEAGENISVIPIAIVADNERSVFVTGNSSAPTREFNIYTMRFDATTGSLHWAEPYSLEGDSYDIVSAIAVDSAGGVYITGTSTNVSLNRRVFSTIKFNVSDGKKVWDIQTAGPSDVAVDMALDNEHNVIVTGYSSQGGTDYDFLTVKYSQTSCPTLAEASIAGSLNVPVRTNRSVYSLAASNASTFAWTITDSGGRVLSSFTGQGSNSITVNWPSSPDVYKVSVIYGGGENCPSNTAIAYVHAFDPQAGFVTGGGWFQSPANPDYEFMQTSTKAQFGLAARYKKGDANLVQGETHLQLENGSFYFRGTAQQARSLVIAGNHAFYRGSGKVSYRNNTGQQTEDPRRFSFLVAATDGGQAKGKNTDKLRIIVWEMNGDGSRGAVVYDNQAGCGGSLDENALACQQINGGNIIIHRPQLQAKKDQQLTSENPADMRGLTAYPTAFSDRTTIAFATEQETAYTLDLYDLKGALVKRIASGTAEEGRLNRHELQAAGLSKGLYFLRLVTGEGMQTVKVVVQH